MLSESYFTNTSKINSKAFEDVCKKIPNYEECKIESNKDRKITNHIPGCFYLHSKKLLFMSMAKYYKKYKFIKLGLTKTCSQSFQRPF